MFYKSIYVSTGSSDSSLGEISSRIFDVLGLVKTDERESSNYPDGHYFVGRATNASLMVRIQDEWSIDFQYVAYLERTPSWAMPEREFNLNTDPMDIAHCLAASSLRTFVASGDDSRTDWDGRGTLFTQGDTLGKSVILKV